MCAEDLEPDHKNGLWDLFTELLGFNQSEVNEGQFFDACRLINWLQENRLDINKALTVTDQRLNL